MGKQYYLLAAVLLIVLFVSFYFFKNDSNQFNIQKQAPSNSTSQTSKKDIINVPDASPEAVVRSADQVHKKKAVPDVMSQSLNSLSKNKAANSPQKGTVDKIAGAIEDIIQQFEADGDKEMAFAALVDINNKLEDENLQTVMKQMTRLSDVGGNEVIVEAFLDQSNPKITDHDKIRILSYLSPEHTLDDAHLESLAHAYNNKIIPTAEESILMALAHSGGDTGALLLIDMAQEETDDRRYIQQITSLGNSNSILALDYLNQTIDTIIKQAPEDQDSELLSLVRTLIQQHPQQE